MQIALLSERINELTEHLKGHKKDCPQPSWLAADGFAARQRLLKYLAANSIVEQYRKLTETLGIRQKI